MQAPLDPDGSRFYLLSVPPMGYANKCQLSFCSIWAEASEFLMHQQPLAFQGQVHVHCSNESYLELLQDEGPAWDLKGSEAHQSLTEEDAGLVVKGPLPPWTRAVL